MKRAPLLALLCFLALGIPASAHEGHDHGADAAPAAPAQAAPRFAVRTEAVEVVGVLQDGQLDLYLDRASDNSPVTDVSIEIESPALSGSAKHLGNGVYQLAAGALAQPGKHALTLTIQGNDLADLLPVTLEVAAPQAKPATRSAAWWGLLLLPLLTLGWWWRRRQNI